jgi:hypothetical protein
VRAAAAPELLDAQAQRQRRQDAAALESESRKEIHARPRCHHTRTRGPQGQLKRGLRCGDGLLLATCMDDAVSAAWTLARCNCIDARLSTYPQRTPR